ncbi:MAG TPA: zf-HC2 domain-containing protein [Gemmatimonadaceae bacterium]|nr:zf-HC2 domain-containing protein [Gemmatimonadaceae bacterium]
MDNQPMSPDMPMMDCDTAMRLLWDLLDGKLGPVDEMAVREHVNMCRHCHPHATFGEIVLNAVAAQRQPVTEELPLRSRVLDALRSEGFEAPSDR